MIGTSDWEREGDPAPGGVGAIRRLGRAPAFSREQIVEYERPRAPVVHDPLAASRCAATTPTSTSPRRRAAPPSAGRPRSSRRSRGPARSSARRCAASCSGTPAPRPRRPSVAPDLRRSGWDASPPRVGTNGSSGACAATSKRTTRRRWAVRIHARSPNITMAASATASPGPTREPMAPPISAAMGTPPAVTIV